MAALDQFREIARDPMGWVARYKAETGTKVVACLPMYAPQEILTAAGVLPFTFLGTDAPIEGANEWAHPYLCHPVRSTLEVAAQQKLGFLDGIVLPDLCDQAKRMAGVWDLCFAPPFLFHFSLPKRQDSPSTKPYMLGELDRFRRTLETFTGHEISDGAISDAIINLNRQRQMLERLYGLRRECPRLFTTTELAAVIMSAMVMPCLDFNRLLKDYLAEKVAANRPAGSDSIRLVLSGNLCEDLEPGFPEMIDELEAVVVDDDLYPGSRYFANLIPEVGPPMEALVDGYLDSIPCPTRYHPQKDITAYLVDVVRRSRGDGVVILVPQFCEIHAFHYPHLKQTLDDSSIPHLLIEGDHSGASGRVRTRLEAFVEQLRS